MTPAGHDCNEHQVPEQALAKLRELGLRLTATRRSLIQVLAAAAGPQPLDAIHQQLGRFDLVTLYRNLHAFEEVGLLQTFRGGDGKLLYELQPAGHHHHHVICRRCGLIRKLDHCDISVYEQQASVLGFTQLTHTLELYGVCGSCRPDRDVD